MANDLVKSPVFAARNNLLTGLNRQGFTLPADLTFDQWRQRGEALGAYNQAMPWAIGDWLNYGDRAYGSKYEAAINLTGLSYKTCANLKYVAGRIEPARRRELSFAHHATVAAYPPDVQSRVLSEAEKEGLNVIQLRTLMKERGYQIENAPPVETIGRQISVDDRGRLVIDDTRANEPKPLEHTGRKSRAKVRNLIHAITPIAEQTLEILQLELNDSGNHLGEVRARLATLIEQATRVLELLSD